LVKVNGVPATARLEGTMSFTRMETVAFVDRPEFVAVTV
jgi:hypothetical protein